MILLIMVSLVVNLWDTALLFHKTLGRREEDEASRRMLLNNNDHGGCLIMRQESLLSATVFPSCLVPLLSKPPCPGRVIINWQVPCSKSTYLSLSSPHPMDSYPFICQVVMGSLNHLSECSLCKLAKGTYISGRPRIHKSSLGSGCLHR